MNKAWLALVFNLLAFGLVIVSHKIDPTNLAGPGLDLVVYPIVVICSFIFCARASFKAQRREATWLPFFIHLVGVIGLIALLFIPQ